MKPWNGKSDSNRDAKSKDIYLRKREDVCALVRAEAASWMVGFWEPTLWLGRNAEIQLGRARKREEDSTPC